jgi:MFS family permease
MLPLFVLAHFFHHFTAAFLQPLTPFIRDEFALDYTQIGLILFAYNLAYGFSHLPAGWLSDHLGPRLMILIGISGVALCAVLTGIAPTYLLLVVFAILMGVMGGGYHPAASPLVAASVDKKSQGRALGLHQIGGTASFFLAPIIVVAIAGALGWRGAVITMAIPAFIIGIVLFIILGKRGYYTRKPPEVTAVPQEGPPAAAGTMRRLVPFIVLGVMLQVMIMAVISYIPLFAVDNLLASEETSAFLYSLFHFAGLWAGPVGGYLSDRLGKVRVMLAVGLIAGPALYLLNLSSLGWSIWLILLVLGTCMYMAMPVAEAYIITHAPQRRRSTILGIYYFASRGGIGLSVPLAGYLADHYSFATSFTVIAGALLAIVLVCTAFLWGSRD